MELKEERQKIVGIISQANSPGVREPTKEPEQKPFSLTVVEKASENMQDNQESSSSSSNPLYENSPQRISHDNLNLPENLLDISKISTSQNTEFYELDTTVDLI